MFEFKLGLLELEREFHPLLSLTIDVKYNPSRIEVDIVKKYLIQYP